MKNIFLYKKRFLFKKNICNSNRNFIENLIWIIVIEINNKIGIGECNSLLKNEEKINGKKKYNNTLFIKEIMKIPIFFLDIKIY